MKNICKKLFVLILLSYVASGLFAAMNEEMYVRVDSLAVKAKAGTYAKTVKTVDYGTLVTVLENKGEWIQIKVDGVSGWVPLSALSKRKVAASRTTVNVKEIALAGRGASDGIEKAFSKAYDEHYGEVDKIEGYSVSEEEVLAFIKEGELNGGEE